VVGLMGGTKLFFEEDGVEGVAQGCAVRKRRQLSRQNHVQLRSRKRCWFRRKKKMRTGDRQPHTYSLSLHLLGEENTRQRRQRISQSTASQSHSSAHAHTTTRIKTHRQFQSYTRQYCGQGPCPLPLLRWRAP
jgi:hypothetical protein